MHRANRHCSDNFEGPPGHKVDSSVMHIWVDADACPAAIKDIQFRAADQHTMDEVAAGDPVVTADIPPAAALIEKGAFALSPRGGFYSTENVRERLGLRDFMEGMRGAGVVLPGRRSCRRQTGRRCRSTRPVSGATAQAPNSFHKI